MPSPKPCPEGQYRNEKTRRCNKIKAVKSDSQAIADVALMKQIQTDYMHLRSELAKMEKDRDQYRHAYENMVRTMAKCNEDLKRRR